MANYGMGVAKTSKNVRHREKRDRVEVVSLDLDIFDYDTAVATIGDIAKSGLGGYVCMSTVHMVMESYDNREYGKKVNAASLVIPDGMPLVWMQKLLGVKNAGRVRANDLMIRLCKYAEDNELRVGFYGGKKEVIDDILIRAKADFPNLEISFAYSPPFRSLTEAETDETINKINSTGTDILFVGLGCPKQENWMNSANDRVTAIMLGVGASFDFYAGEIQECPPWIGNLGLEWLFRLSREPKRLWKRYLIHNPRFVVLALRQLITGKSAL